MFAESEPPECYWLPRPYSEEDQAEVARVAQADKVEFVPWASLRRLADGMASARNQKIPILATEGDPADGLPSLAGWAAAVGAKNVLTGEPAPAPPAEIQKTLDMLKMYGNNGWSDFKTNVGTMTRTHGKTLADAGYPADWVVSYFIGQGLDRHSSERLRQFLSENVTA